jgi:hypothetical protein
MTIFFLADFLSLIICLAFDNFSSLEMLSTFGLFDRYQQMVEVIIQENNTMIAIIITDPMIRRYFLKNGSSVVPKEVVSDSDEEFVSVFDEVIVGVIDGVVRVVEPVVCVGVILM